MVITIEPGLYISKSDERAPAKYRGISVRIEDDLLVTADGATVLTQSAFKEPADIEEMMKVGKGMREELGEGQLVVPPRIRDC
jgi:Xaa-Pro aminopeptidase